MAQQLQTAQFLPGSAAEELTGELICYARSVAGTEWDALAAGTLGDSVNPWIGSWIASSPVGFYLLAVYGDGVDDDHVEGDDDR